VAPNLHQLLIGPRQSAAPAPRFSGRAGNGYRVLGFF